jgi:outer membrane protein insertion porin family
MQEVRRAALRRLLIPVCLGCLWVEGALASPEEFEGRRVAIIRFLPQQQPLPASEMERLLPVKMKQPLHMAEVRAAMEVLYATGRYADIAADAELRNGEIILTFITRNNWFVGRVSVEGVHPPPTAPQLQNATKLALGELYLQEKSDQAVANLTQSLRANGFYQFHVQPRLDYDSRTQQVNISFQVESGPRVSLAPPILRGDLKLPEAKIVRATHWKGWLGWHPMTEDRVQRGLTRVRRIYEKQDYMMAGVTLTDIRVDPTAAYAWPVLDIAAGSPVLVRASGAKLKRNTLRKLVPTFEERSVDRDLLLEGARNLTGYFQSEGYFDARVNFKTTAEGANQVIEYNIEKGAHHKLRRVEIHGNHYFNTHTVSERLAILPASLEYRHGRYSPDLLRHDEDAISDLYRSNGFRDVEVHGQVVNDYLGKPGQVAVVFDIHEGPQWLVSVVAVEGLDTAADARVRGMLGTAPGQPFSETNVAVDRDAVLADYYDRGYPDASFEWSWKPAAAPHRVDVHFAIHTGRRQYVREVLINGLRDTRPQLVNRRILLNPGDPLSQGKMIETQRRLNDLGIFAKVDMALQNPDGDEPGKYVLYQLEESQKYSVSTGLGAEIARIGGDITSFDSPAGEAGFSPRVSLDVSRLNFRGLGLTLSLKGRVSTIQQRALASYTAPQFQSHDNLTLSYVALFDKSLDVRTFAARRWEGSVQLAQRFRRSKTFLYRFSYRRVTVDEGTLKIAAALIPLLSQPARIGMLSGSYVDDRRDDPIDAHKGTYNSIDLGLASKGFGSQTNFLRLLARNSTYHRLNPKLTLARGLTFGWLQSYNVPAGLADPTQDIPLPERLFAGGASSIRAFPDNQAGPRDLTTGFPLGGKAMLINSTELRFPLVGETLGGVLFHDAGNVYSTIGDVSFRFHQRDKTDFNYMVHAVGIGFRYRTPIGPLRLDLAFSPNSPRFYGFKGTQEQLLLGQGVLTDQRINRFQFHFSLGQAF